jgi:hypothetical protein
MVTVYPYQGKNKGKLHDFRKGLFGCTILGAKIIKNLGINYSGKTLRVYN